MVFSRLFSHLGPKIKIASTKKDGFSGWLKCGGCNEMIHANELIDRCNCCPRCDYHYRLSVQQRIALLSDEGSFQEMFTDIKTTDPLGFVDEEAYTARAQKAREKSGRDEAICVGSCTMNGIPILLGIFDFSFMGGSMGSAVGERLTCLMELALERKEPLVVVTASGGARMQESIFSLMQMAKTSAAIGKLGEAKVPYITVLTNPTTGGVTASFASLGDIILAEPGALIGFAGPRVIEQTTKHKLPKGAQTAEFLLERGMVDLVVRRAELKKKIAYVVDFLRNNNRVSVELPARDPSQGEDLDVPSRIKRFFEYISEAVS